jgi:hypothetical protein
LTSRGAKSILIRSGSEKSEPFPFGARLPDMGQIRPTASKEEYAKFEKALKKVLSVSHSEIQAKIASEKKRKKRP